MITQDVNEENLKEILIRRLEYLEDAVKASNVSIKDYAKNMYYIIVEEKEIDVPQSECFFDVLIDKINILNEIIRETNKIINRLPK